LGHEFGVKCDILSDFATNARFSPTLLKNNEIFFPDRYRRGGLRGEWLQLRQNRHLLLPIFWENP
tara:strand:+ start:286 stop:480 length:195 start_codon:yes stop_codon:yes gene_type:complete